MRGGAWYNPMTWGQTTNPAGAEGDWFSGWFGKGKKKKAEDPAAGMVQPGEDASPEQEPVQFNPEATASEGETTVQDDTPPATPEQEGGKRRRRKRRKSRRKSKKRGGGCGCASPLVGGRRKKKRRTRKKKKTKRRRRR